MKDDLLTIGKIAKSLDCSTATVRNYVSFFGEFLSETASRQYRKRFTYDDLATLRNIQHRLNVDGMSYDEAHDFMSHITITEILDTHEQVNTYDEPISQDNAIAPIEYFEHIRSLLEGERDQHEKHLQAKDEFIEHLQDENERLREQLERERLPWWKKIMG